MEYRELGTQRLRVGAIGLGCVGISDLYGPRNPERSAATLRRALELGVDFFDTSDVYGAGHNEAFVGQHLAQHRDEIVVATKFGALRTPDGPGVNGRPDYVVAACEASLARLGTDRIDLYYQHRVDPTTPIEETVGAMAGLVASGKVRHLGLSECSVATLRRAHAVHPITAVQIEYSLVARHAENDMLQACQELGAGVVAYCPLGRGLLSGATDMAALSPDDYRHRDPRYASSNLQHNLGLVAQAAAVADRMGCTVGQLALAWLLHRAADIVPIPGTTCIAHLEQNVAAAELSLTDEDFELLCSLLPNGSVAGERYPPNELNRVNL